MTTPIRLQPGAVEKLRRLTRLVSVELDRDTTQSEILDALADYGLEHVPEVTERVREGKR
jgi:hypothetical protein